MTKDQSTQDKPRYAGRTQLSIEILKEYFDRSMIVLCDPMFPTPVQNRIENLVTNGRGYQDSKRSVPYDNSNDITSKVDIIDPNNRLPLLTLGLLCYDSNLPILKNVGRTPIQERIEKMVTNGSDYSHSLTRDLNRWSYMDYTALDDSGSMNSLLDKSSPAAA